MQNGIEQEIINHPDFQLLLKKRGRFRVVLISVLIVLYVGFALIALYLPEWFAVPVAEGSAMNLGIVAAYAIIFLCIAFSGYYVHRANTEFTALEQSVKDHIEKDLGA